MAYAIFRVFVLICAVTFLGCAVIDKGTAKDTYQKLATWKARAESAPDSLAFNEAKICINAWITAKQTEIAIAGAQFFSTINLQIPDDLNNKVEIVVGKEVKGIEELIGTLLSAILKSYENSRKDEASIATARLECYKWEAKKK